MSEQAAPWNYGPLALWAGTTSKYDFDTKSLDAVVQAFFDNVNRIRALSLMPGVVTAHAMRGEQPHPPVGEDFVKGVKALESYAGSIPAVRDGMRHLFSSVVVGAWTAFEVLATDLWVESVNQRPMSLGTRAMKAPRKQSQFDDAQEQAAAKAKLQTISVDLLAKYRFDLKDRIGYYLWRERHFDFNSLPTLKYAYRAAFDKVADDWFSDPLFSHLGTLEATRHVLVHRGGVIDQSFLDRVKSNPHLSKLKVGQKAEFDGLIASQSGEIALACGLKLLDRVDDWLTANVE